MAAYRFRFLTAPDEKVLRERIRAEVGRRASERNLDFDRPSDHDLMVLSQDVIALVYAAKVCMAEGGVRVDLSTGEPSPHDLPEWTQTPWVRLPYWRRFRLWLGPTPV